MRIAVYTANFGIKELFEPVVVSDKVDYIYFTDKPVASKHWQVNLVERKFDDARLESRYYFDNSTTVLSDYDITIMHGANAQLTIKPEELIRKFLLSDIAAFLHPHRKCLYKEAEVCKQLNKDTAYHIDKQMLRYMQANFPDNYGLHACGLLIRKNTEAVKNFEQLWWDEVSQYSYRDQLSFDYIRWKTRMIVTPIPGDIFNNSYLRVNLHDRK